MRWLLSIALLCPAALWAQASADGFPCYKAGAGGTGAYNVAGVLNGSGDNITCTCGIPPGVANYSITGAPLGNVAALQAYSNDSYTPDMVSSQMPQRSMDWCAPYGQTTIVNSYPTVVYFPGGGNYHIAQSAMWAQVGALPGFVFVVADPNQTATPGFNFIVASYETAAYINLKSAQLSTDTTICVAQSANHVFPTAAEINTAQSNGTPVSINVEGEVEVVTHDAGSSGGCTGGVPHLLTVTRAAGVAHSTTGVNVWLTDFTGANTEDASLYDAVTLMNAIACNGWGNRHDIRLLGGSNGSWIAGMLAGMGASDKTTYRLAANNEYTCGNVDDWQITSTMLLSPPVAQDSVTTVSNDSSEPAGNSIHFGRGNAGNIQSTKSLSDSGCTGNNSTACSLGACTPTGLTPNGTLSAWGLVSRQKSPQQNHKGNTPGSCTAYNSCPGLFHTTQLPSIGIAMGNADGNIDNGTSSPVIVPCYAQTFSAPMVIANDCPGNSCPHEFCEAGNGGGAWDVQAQCIAMTLRSLGVPDGNYGVIGKGSSAGGVIGGGRGAQ